MDKGITGIPENGELGDVAKAPLGSQLVEDNVLGDVEQQLRVKALPEFKFTNEVGVQNGLV